MALFDRRGSSPRRCLAAAHRGPADLLANAEVRIVYRQEPDQLAPTATALGLTGTEQSLLPQLGTGQGLWRIGRPSFVVQHQLAAEELAAFDTTQRMRLTPAVSASGPG